MHLEYDPAKSASNEEKHSIDFEEAQHLWEDPDMISMRADRNGEHRNMMIARYSGMYWAAIYTMRPDCIRIISVRKASKGEVSCYDRHRNG